MEGKGREMETCPKCGFSNAMPATDCLKCGVNFAKVGQARATERAALQNEAAINHKIERVLTRNFPLDEDLYHRENEALHDRESYPFIEFLSTFFLFAASLVGVACIVGTIYFWGFLTQLSFFSAQNKFVLLAAIILSDAISVGILLAISGALTLGRDIANNTRASRECLFELVRTKQA
jgi:hypothetical protein